MFALSIFRVRPALLGVALALASCAPTVTAPQLGRIVNGKTGAEGTVSFERGSLRPLVADPFAPDNTRIQLGDDLYTGRTQLVARGGTAPLPAGWGLSVGVAGGTGAGPLGQVGWDTRLDSPRAAAPAYSGNLIARTSGVRVRTLTCTLLVDAQEHGIGECTGEDGTKYAMQF
ncbi:hypothetical protein WDJ50_01500 [Deinococcus sp. VB142]|uniref:Uncharacterized protein n=1 Tax=Deinococcus sp. VB142 TaxID=3112952 RepID=A0AAU6Q2I6_9DEIO